MATLIDVFKSFLANQPRYEIPKPSGFATDEGQLYPISTPEKLEQYTVLAKQFSPDAPIMPDPYTSDDPLAPGGAREVLSVVQTKGARVTYKPSAVRTYPVRGSIV